MENETNWNPWSDFVTVTVIAGMSDKLNNHMFNNFYACPKVGQITLISNCSLFSINSLFKLEGILLQKRTPLTKRYGILWDRRK